MLRPTESPTLFLQQLGRGLRKADGKTVCTVLDFVGSHRTEFRFDRRFRALLGGSRTRRRAPGRATASRSCPRAATSSSIRSLSEIVLAQHPRGDPDRGGATSATSCGRSATSSLATYLEETGLDLDDVYAGNHSWTETAASGRAADCAALAQTKARCSGRSDGCSTSTTTSASTPTDVFSHRASRPIPTRLTNASGGCCACSSRSLDDAVDVGVARRGASRSCGHTRRCGRAPRAARRPSATASTTCTPPLRPSGRAASRSTPGTPGPRSSPRSASVQGAKPPTWQTGVYGTTGAEADLFAFTLDKSGGGFSPTTRYRDYAISRELIHWESQSTTSVDSDDRPALHQPRERRARTSCSSPGSVPTTARSGASAPPATRATRATGRSPSSGSWTIPSRPISTPRSLPRSRRPVRRRSAQVRQVGPRQGEWIRPSVRPSRPPRRDREDRRLGSTPAAGGRGRQERVTDRRSSQGARRQKGRPSPGLRPAGARPAARPPVDRRGRCGRARRRRAR